MGTTPLIAERVFLNLSEFLSCSFLSVSACWSNQKQFCGINKIRKLIRRAINKCKHIKHHVDIIRER